MHKPRFILATKNTKNHSERQFIASTCSSGTEIHKPEGVLGIDVDPPLMSGLSIKLSLKSSIDKISRQLHRLFMVSFSTFSGVKKLAKVTKGKGIGDIKLVWKSVKSKWRAPPKQRTLKIYHSVSGKTLVEYIFTTYGVYIAFGMLLNI